MGRSRRNDDVDEGLAAQYSEPLVAGEDLESGGVEVAPPAPVASNQVSEANTNISSNNNNSVSGASSSALDTSDVNEHSEYTVNSTLNTT